MYWLHLKLKKVACLIQDVVSPHCGDKRMVRLCMRSSLPNYFVMMSYHWNVGKTHQCKQRKQSYCLMVIHLFDVWRIHGHILISKDIVSIFSAFLRSTFLLKKHCRTIVQ